MRAAPRVLMNATVLGLLASASASSSLADPFRSATDEFVAAVMSPCITSVAEGGRVADTAPAFGMKLVEGVQVVPEPTPRTVWRFPTGSGELYVSVAQDGASDCMVTGRKVNLESIRMRLHRFFGKPANERRVGSAAQEAFQVKQGGMLMVSYFPNTPQGPEVNPLYVKQ